MQEKGVRRTENGAFCEKCGTDLYKKGSVRFIMHADGKGCCTNYYECNKCGAPIEQTFERPNMF